MKKERKMLSKFLFTDRMGCYKGISYGFWNSYWYLPIYRQCVFVLKWTLFCILLYPVYKPPHKASQLNLISCCGNFVETHKSCRISGESSDNFGTRELGQLRCFTQWTEIYAPDKIIFSSVFFSWLRWNCVM